MLVTFHHLVHSKPKKAKRIGSLTLDPKETAGGGVAGFQMNRNFTRRPPPQMAANHIIPQKPRNTSPLASTIATPKRKRRRKSSTFYKELKSRHPHQASGGEIKNPWLIKEDQHSLSQCPQGLHPAALTLWIYGNMARKRNTQLSLAIKLLEALPEKEPYGETRHNTLHKKGILHLVKLREMNAKSNFIKGPLWRELGSKLHGSGGLSFLTLLTGLLCFEKITPQQELNGLRLGEAMKIVAQEAGYKEFMDKVCPVLAAQFIEGFHNCCLWAGMGLKSDDAVALNTITEVMTDVVAETEDFPRNLGNDNASKTFLHPDVIEAFTDETERGDDRHRKLYKRRNEAARSFVLGYQRLEAMRPTKPKCNNR